MTKVSLDKNEKNYIGLHQLGKKVSASECCSRICPCQSHLHLVKNLDKKFNFVLMEMEIFREHPYFEKM